MTEMESHCCIENDDITVFEVGMKRDLGCTVCIKDVHELKGTYAMLKGMEMLMKLAWELESG